MKFRIGVGAIVLLALIGTGCAKARHVAVQVDAAYSQAVYALDDAQYQLCQQKQLDMATCDKLDPIVKAALQDAKALTASLQATSGSDRIPTTLPDLLQHLNQAQAIIAPFAGRGGAVGDLAVKGTDALNKAIALLRTFAGG